MGTLEGAALEQQSHNNNYERVHYDIVNDLMVMEVNKYCENTFVRVTQKQKNMYMLELLAIAAKEHHAYFSSTAYSTLKGLDLEIDPDSPPKNFKNTMSRKERQDSRKWAEALRLRSKHYWDTKMSLMQ